MRSLLVLLTLLAASACRSAPASEGFAARVERAHGGRSIYAMPPLHARVTVDFDGERMLDARMLYDAATGRVRLEREDGAVAVFDGDQAWARGFTPDELPMARFHLLTWPYFLAAPWKLDDPGARLGVVRDRELAGTLHASARLTFADDVGDTPDDWYVVYAEPASLRLTALAYVVTYGKTPEQAATEPHAATYDAWETHEGLRLPTHLRFWNWTESDGLIGDPIGEARFEGLRFAPAANGAFDAPHGSQAVPVPE